MKKFLKNRKAKGFTLVELLIVLIIIGILAGALLLVAGAGTDKANATKIVSDLRSAKAAALMNYADVSGNWASVDVDEMKKFLESGANADAIDLASADSGATIYVTFNLDTAGLNSDGVKSKIKALRESGVPLYNAAATSTASPDYTSSDTVYMRVN